MAAVGFRLPKEASATGVRRLRVLGEENNGEEGETHLVLLRLGVQFQI